MQSVEALHPATGALETLIVTWQNPKTRTYYRIGVLAHDAQGDTYTFEYVDGVDSVADFTPLVGLESTSAIHTSTKLFPVFAERIMDDRRPSFDEWLRALHTDKHASPMEILARSHGKRGSDTLQLFSLPEPLPDGRAQDKFFVHGVRHLIGASDRIDTLDPGQGLDVIDDASNVVDSRALIVAADGTKLGWVPGPLLSYVHSLRNSEGWRCTAVQTNPASSGSHQRLLVQVEGTYPAGQNMLEDFLASPSL